MRNFSGIEFRSMNRERLVETLKGSRMGFSVHFVAASTFFGSRKDKDFSTILKDAIVIADSKPLQSYLRFKYREFEGVRGSDFLRYFVQVSDSRMVLVGSDSKVTDQLVSRLMALNPNIQIPLVINPPFKDDLSEESHFWEKEISKLSVNVVWIGLGSPKQDYLARQLSIKLNTHVIAVGAAFDFVSNVLPEAPDWMISKHLEWLHRLIIEPKRLWKRYLFGNLYFLTLMARDFVSSKGESPCS